MQWKKSNKIIQTTINGSSSMTGREGSPVYSELLSIIMYLHTCKKKPKLLKTPYLCMYFIPYYMLLKSQEEMTN